MEFLNKEINHRMPHPAVPTDFFGGGSTSGKMVTERSAMQMTAVYSCVRILSEAVASLTMELAKIKAYICEGAAEAAIIDVLLDNDLLIFQRKEVLDEGVIRCRDGKTFETRYLRKGFHELISVIRILKSALFYEKSNS